MSNTAFIATGNLRSYGALSSLWTFGRDCWELKPQQYTRFDAGDLRSDGFEAGPYGLGLSGTASSGEVLLGAVDCPLADWILPWWNVDLSGSGRLEILVRFGVDGDWSAWYPMGLWSARSSSFKGEDNQASIKTDTLFLTEKTTRYQAKLIFATDEAMGSVYLRRFGLISRDRNHRAPPTKSCFLKEGGRPVPLRSQMLEAPEIHGKICSPTCCSMALESLGLGYPTMFVAADCLDSGAGIYGNWPFNVASLWRLGARARLEYYPNVEAAAGDLIGGSLLIASIRFGEGELQGTPITKSSGHLVLVRGFEKDREGKVRVLVNDPAAKEEAEVPMSYFLEEFEKAWTGVAYVVEGRR
ncbi:MAG: C39 family peptidase [Spirochaetes bacterium]|nr:C39 family peptidase [Spirochaetota bacterium]